MPALPTIPLRRVARFLAVVAIAMAAGHLVQTMAARKTVVQAQAAANLPTEIVQLSAGPSEPQVNIVHIPAGPDFLSAATTMDGFRATPICRDAMTLRAEPAGMIGVDLTAPCRAAERIVLRHAGLAVTGRIGPDGRFSTDLPALSVAGTVQILLQDGTKVTDAVIIPEAATLRRFGVQWQGGEAFVVHGFENGADFGQPGDISANNRGGVGGGVLTPLGDASVENPLLAQIYTYPTDPAAVTEVVLEAAVTTGTCGHDLLGEAIVTNAGRTTITDLTLAMPDCSGVGDFLVLKNLASDMKIAAN